jgi:hypothetical protein
MALHFSNLPATYKWGISFNVAGVAKPETFTAEFRRLPGERVKEIVNTVKASARMGDDAENDYDEIDLVMEVMEGWDAKGDDGKEIPFGEEIIRKVASAIPSFPGEVIGAYISSVYRGKEKNSKAS